MIHNPSQAVGKLEALLNFDQTPVVQNTWYTALTHSARGRIRTLVVYQGNTETAAKTIECELLFDGSRTIVATGSLNHNAANRWVLNDTADSAGFTTSQLLVNYYAPLEYTTLRIRVRTTDAPGTAQHLYVIANYESIVS